MTIRRLKKISQEEKNTIIEALKVFLRQYEEVIFAFLYGSFVDPVFPEKYGDIDLALYVKPELLKTPEFIWEAKIEVGAYKFFSERGINPPPLEVRIINRAPYHFLVKLLKGKYLMIKQNEDTFTEFIEDVSGRAMANSFIRSESLREVLGINL